MAKNSCPVFHIEEVSLDLIDIGRVGKEQSSDIDELAASIRKNGLLQPICVVKKPNNRYQILQGVRRFLACRKLSHKTIAALSTDSTKIDNDMIAAISLAESSVRQPVSQKDLSECCNALLKRYGSIKKVAEETGLSRSVVSQYIRYDRLIPALRAKVDNGEVEMKIALQAQKAATARDGTVDSKAIMGHAKKLGPMNNQQRKAYAQAIRASSTNVPKRKHTRKGQKA
jgi:ParB family chromosome partitioning protein